METSIEKKCPKCKTANPQEANYCRHCGAKFDPTPEILDFRLDAKCHVGDFADLSWKISNAEKVTLNGQDVTDKKSYHIYIAHDTFYTLTAIKGGRTISRTIHIQPQKDRKGHEESLRTVKTGETRKYTLYSIITIITSILAMIMLAVIFFYENEIQYYFGIGYSDWPVIKTTFIIINVAMLIISMSLFYSIIKLLKK